MANSEFRASVHEHFAQLRDQVLASPDLTQAVRDILQSLDEDIEDQP